ncbi:hypothetical protein BJS_04903 [Bradyrhizobium japonicum SEMIA 5079]|nr:hypothetical protein BJS_04903 [Bradyrhizobium japonicum SEMIA 5079]
MAPPPSLSYLIGWPKSGRRNDPARRKVLNSGLFLLQDLTALVHAGLEVEMVRTTELAGVLVFHIGRLLDGVCRAAHATTRRRGFSSRNGHFNIL